MITALRWIWDQVCKLAALVGSLASSIWTWIAAGFALVANTVVGWVASAVSGVLPEVEWPEMVTDASELFRALVHWFALDIAVGSLVTIITAWVLARVARLVMVPIRALLEIF